MTCFRKYIIPSYKSFVKLISSSEIMEDKYYHAFCPKQEQRYVFYPKEYLNMYDSDGSIVTQPKYKKDSLEAKCSRVGIFSIPCDCVDILKRNNVRPEICKKVSDSIQDTSLPMDESVMSIMMFITGMYVVNEHVKHKNMECKCAFTLTNNEHTSTRSDVLGVEFKTHHAY